MDLTDLVATNLRRARQARSLTQEELADRAGLSARYLGSIERVRVTPSVRILGKLAAALEIDPRELLEGWQPA